MKKRLLLLISIVWLSACQSARVASIQVSTTENTKQTSSDFEATASLDPLPVLPNAAQTSILEELPLVSPAKKPGFAPKKPTILKTLRMARHLTHSFQDSTQLYTRRKPIETRPVHKLSAVSLWTGIGSYILLILSAISGILGLLSVLAAVAAVVTGIISLSELRRFGDQYRGKGRAIAGIVLGSTYLLMILAILAIVILVLATL